MTAPQTTPTHTEIVVSTAMAAVDFTCGLLLQHAEGIVLGANRAGRSSSRTLTARRVLGAALACGVAALALPAAAPAAFGDAQVLAPFPDQPGFPEGIAVRSGRVYSAGAATFGTAGKRPSAVLVHNRATGALLKRYDTIGENLAFEHANSSIAFDGQSRLYVLNTQLGVYRLNVANGTQTAYTPPFPDLPASASPPWRPAHQRRLMPPHCPTTSPSRPTATPTSPTRCRRRSGASPVVAAPRRSGAKTAASPLLASGSTACG